MTINEALEKGIERVRNPIWSNPNAYLKISNMWCFLFDDINQKALDMPVGSQSMLKFQCGNDNYWEEYTGEISSEEQ
jgi:hypothetical protein